MSVVRLAVMAAPLFFYLSTAAGDEAPIAGTVKAIDATARTITVEAPRKTGARVVVIDIRPESKIVRTRRSVDPTGPGFVEQAVALEEIKPGWTVSVTTKHEGDREVAIVLKVLAERRAP